MVRLQMLEEACSVLGREGPNSNALAEAMHTLHTATTQCVHLLAFKKRRHLGFGGEGEHSFAAFQTQMLMHTSALVARWSKRLARRNSNAGKWHNPVYQIRKTLETSPGLSKPQN